MIKPTENNKTKVTPLEELKSNYYLLEKLDLFPDVKCDLEEVLTELRIGLSEDIIEQNKSYLVKKLYLNNYPDFYYISELSRVISHMNGIFIRLDTKFKDYKDFVIDVPMGKHIYRTYDVHMYFRIATIHFSPFYLFAKSRINEIKEINKKHYNNQTAEAEQQATLNKKQSEKQKPKQENPKTFEELFYNIDLVTPCVDILKELDPPLIDTDCNYIGKLKGVFCVWIEEMQRQGIIKSNYPEERKLLASLIPQKIKRFSIDESMFGKYQSKAEQNYRTDIKTKVSKIKLSQNSQ